MEEELGVVKNDWVNLKFGDTIMRFHVRDIYDETETIYQENQNEKDKIFYTNYTIVKLEYEKGFHCEPAKYTPIKFKIIKEVKNEKCDNR